MFLEYSCTCFALASYTLVICQPKKTQPTIKRVTMELEEGLHCNLKENCRKRRYIRGNLRMYNIIPTILNSCNFQVRHTGQFSAMCNEGKIEPVDWACQNIICSRTPELRKVRPSYKGELVAGIRWLPPICIEYSICLRC